MTAVEVACTEESDARPESARERRRVDRRRRPTRALSRYTFFGGRRAGDRRGTGDTGTYVDRYEAWLAAALVATAALCALDAVFTLQYIQRGGTEANPVMAWAIGWGPVPFLVLKCVVTNVGLVILCLHKNFRHVKAVVGALLGIYAALLVYHLWLIAALG